jgi:hypothetical protein
MDVIDKQQLYRTAWKHWGPELQMDILIEEMSELIHAIIKARRNGTFYTYALSDEMADVLICLEQLETAMRDFPTFDNSGMEITGCVFDQVQDIKENKLNRFKELLLQSMIRKANSER